MTTSYVERLKSYLHHHRPIPVTTHHSNIYRCPVPPNSQSNRIRQNTTPLLGPGAGGPVRAAESIFGILVIGQREARAQVKKHQCRGEPATLAGQKRSSDHLPLSPCCIIRHGVEGGGRPIDTPKETLPLRGSGTTVAVAVMAVHGGGCGQ
jgi:hypothetical protein